jgi:3',5'-cyclic AMP phosphodiesterase CpdA
MSNELKFYHITDTHHYAVTALGTSDEEDQKCMNESGAILDAAFEKLAAQEEIDIILLSGDLTNNGERPSHTEFIEKLYRLKTAGKRVYVTTATHDYGLRELKDGDTAENSTHASRSELKNMYIDFGFSEAIAEYTDGLSYVAQLAPGYRVLALNDDNCGTDEFEEPQMNWIREQVKAADDAGDFIIAMEHHPVLPPSPVYPLFSGHDMRSYGNKAALLADAGVQFVFTGHAHMQNISSITTEKGNTLWDINTGSLVGYPTPMRHIVLDDEKMSITSEKIDSFDWDLKGKTADEYLIAHFDFMLNDVFDSMAFDLDRLGALGGGFGISREFVHKMRIPIKIVGKIMQKLTVGKVGRLLCISRKVDKSVRNILIKDLVIEIIRNIFTGNEHYSPDTPMYKAIMAAVTKVHPIVRHFIKGNKIIEDLPWLVSHMIYDDTPDNEAVLPRKA